MLENYYLQKTIIIAGTGNTGLLVGAVLSRIYQNCNIIILDKSLSDSIGVGEGTTPSFFQLMNLCGFKVPDWFNAINVTLKAGGRYINWHGNNKDIFHPFNFNLRGIDAFSSANLPDDLLQVYTVPNLEGIKNNQYKIIGDDNWDHYGIHFDNFLLRDFLYENLKSRQNVTFIFNEIVSVEYNDDNIARIDCKSGQTLQADFYIDCTGHAGVLSKNKSRKELLGDIFVNTAVVSQIPYNENIIANAYTESIATDHGWIFKLPNQSRIGSGLCFNRNCTSLEDAKNYFINYWLQTHDYVVSPDTLRVVNWDPFCLTDPWKGNCISMGMSAGFLEPLEATSIAHLGFMLITFLQFFEPWFKETDMRNIYYDRFNTNHVKFINDEIDFIRIHYNSDRVDTPFWQYVKDNYKISENELYFIELMKDPTVSANFDQNNLTPFHYPNYSLWLNQHKGHPMNFNLEIAEQQSITDKIKAQIYSDNENNDTYGTFELGDFYLQNFVSQN